MSNVTHKVSAVDPATCDKPKPPIYIAMQRAAARFYVVSGTNQGMNFLDTRNQRILNIHNVVSYLNANSADPVGWQAVASYQHWRSLLPQDEYHPSQPPIMELEPGLCVKNLWRAPEVEPDSASNPWPFTHFMSFAFGDEEAQYMIKWLAWQYQRPLDKPHTGLFIYGPQGSGKGFIADVLTAVFGDSAVTRLSDSGQLSSMSHVDLWQRTLLICEEVYFSQKSKKLANSIKAYMGSDRTSADRKNAHFAEYAIPANPIFFSNHPPKFLEEDDRRWFVREMQKQPETSYYSLLYRWLEGGGASAVAHLLSTTDISDVSLSDRPMMTAEKQLAMGIATSDDIHVVSAKIEQFLDPEKKDKNKGCVFTPSLFADGPGNKMVHIAPKVGLQVVDLNAISGKQRTKTTGFTASECKRLYVPKDAEIFQNAAEKNAYWIKCDYLGVDGPLAKYKVDYLAW